MKNLKKKLGEIESNMNLFSRKQIQKLKEKEAENEKLKVENADLKKKLNKIKEAKNIKAKNKEGFFESKFYQLEKEFENLQKDK